MERTLIIITIMILTLTAVFLGTSEASIKRINGYYRSNGTYVSSHWRDTSNDGYEYNNANYLGWN